MKKILGIGNALVDIMTSLTDDTMLNELNLPKGSMQLVEENIINQALEKTKGLPQTLTAGGSAANTINGLANLDADTAFIGKVGKDSMGRFFRQDMIDNGVKPLLLDGKSNTGMALALVSPDAERTFAVNLGCAIELTPYDLSQELFEGYNCLHIEGYLVQNHSLIEKAVTLAKQSGLLVSLDLASYNVVEANREFLHSIVKKYVDIVFANEEEAIAFTGEQPAESLTTIASMAHIAVVKIGAKGSLIKSGTDSFTVGVIKANPIDSTGAGDMYAAGFLYGLTKGYDLQKCGEIGAVLSGKIIEVIGAKLQKDKWVEIKLMIDRITKGEKVLM